MEKGQAGESMADFVDSKKLDGEAGENLKKVTGQAYTRLNEFISKQDPHKQMLGLTRVTFLDKTEWISPAAVADWKKCAMKRRYDKVSQGDVRGEVVGMDKASFRAYLVGKLESDPDGADLLHCFVYHQVTADGHPQL